MSSIVVDVPAMIQRYKMNIANRFALRFGTDIIKEVMIGNYSKPPKLELASKKVTELDADTHKEMDQELPSTTDGEGSTEEDKPSKPFKNLEDVPPAPETVREGSPRINKMEKLLNQFLVFMYDHTTPSNIYIIRQKVQHLIEASKKHSKGSCKLKLSKLIWKAVESKEELHGLVLHYIKQTLGIQDIGSISQPSIGTVLPRMSLKKRKSNGS